jgi:OOP family OmpA-OmpF porin
MLLSATEAQAEGIDHFQAANNSSDFLVTDDAATLEEGQAAGWIVGDYVYSPLVVRNQDGEIVDVILRHQVRSQAMASFGLFNWLELGIGAPAYYLNGPSTSTLALGDPRVSAQFRLLPWTEGLVASLKLEADLPLARFNGIPLAAQVTGDPFPTVTPSVLLGFNHKWFKLGTEIGHTFRLPKDVAGMRIGSGISYSVGGQVALWPEVLYLTGDLYGDFNYPTPFLEDYFTERFATPMEFAGGMKLYLGDIVLVAGGGTGLVADYGTSAARLFVGVGWEPQPEPPHECPVCEPELVEVPVEKPQPEPEPEPQPAVQPEPEPKAKTVNSTLVILRPDRIEILDPIHFEFDSDVIKKESYIILENVAAVIKQNEEIRKVSIEGHTDNVGSYEYNDDLSKRRAESVKRHLIEEGGIEEERLVTKGFGEYKPLIENDTPKNRAINRRVEFIIVTRAVEVPVELEVED